MEFKVTSETVAEACPSLKVEMQTSRGSEAATPWLVTAPGEWPWNGHWFNPTTNPMDALLAAESFGLFDLDADGNFSHLCRGADGKWMVGHREFKDICLGHGTFCEAICRAIIATRHLKEEAAK